MEAKGNDTQIKDLVIDNPQLIPVMEKYHLDYYCHGERTLEEACIENQLNPDFIESEIDKIEEKEEVLSLPHFEYWPTELIIEHIIDNHHTYLKEKLPVIAIHLKKAVEKDAEKFPAIVEIDNLFSFVNKEINEHIDHEIATLFPTLIDLEEKSEKHAEGHSCKALISLERLEAEDIENAFSIIRDLSSEFTIPEGGVSVATIRSLMKLKELEINLHIYFHLENNILFQRIGELEARRFKPTQKEFWKDGSLSLSVE